MRRKWIAGLVVGDALAFTPSAGAHGPTAVAAKSCSRSYTKATIGGAVKCLRRGEYCAKEYKSIYRRYGFVCSGDPARLH